MTENELNPNEEEEIDDDSLNLEEEDDFEVEEEDTDEVVELSDEEKEEIALSVHNAKVGKNFKSWDDVIKSEKHKDAFIAQHPQKKKSEVKPKPKAQPVTQKGGQFDADLVEEVMFNSFPELRKAPETLTELREAAELKGLSPLSLYKQSVYLKNKAKAESSENAEIDENKERVSTPSGNVPKGKKVKTTPEDIRLADKFFGGDIERYLKFKKSQ